ncbi:MAG: cytidylate kinase-like family protein [Verrucomicrobia bacterium]|nr:cytidylate kinase-like family protein [Verrucomicrobiota bacterium]
MSDSLLDPLAGCRAYLEAHRRQATQEQKKALPFITFSREAGAGAVTIAELTARLLNEGHPEGPSWTVFDKNLVEKVVEDHRFPEHLKRFLPEDVLPGVASAVEEMLGLHPSAWSLAEYTTETILRLAHLGKVILVGRGSNFITAKLRPALHIRLVAPLEERVAHIAEFYHLTQEEAVNYTKKADQGRTRYVKRYFRAAIDDPLNYSLTINTGRVPFEAAAHVIAEAIRSL